MTYLEAAVAVLKASRRATTTEEITDAAIRQGLINPCGKTPVQTMGAALYRHIYEDAARPVLQRESQPGPLGRPFTLWRFYLVNAYFGG